MRNLWFLWSTIAWISTALCTAGCILPYWLKGTIYIGINEELAKAMGIHLTKLPSTMGLYRRCVYPVYQDKQSDPAIYNFDTATDNDEYMVTTERAGLIRIRSGCGYYLFEQIPHSMWRAALTLLSLACIMLWFISFFLLFVGCYIGLLRYPTLTRACQALLLVSGSLVLSSCVLYPIGWTNNPEVKQICGDRSSSFSLGRCQLGWAYLMTILGGFLSILGSALPSLCMHSAMSRRAQFCCCLVPPEPNKCAAGEMELSSKTPMGVPASITHRTAQLAMDNSRVLRCPGKLYARAQHPVFLCPSPYGNLPTQSLNSQPTNSSMIGSTTDTDSRVRVDNRRSLLECSH